MVYTAVVVIALLLVLLVVRNRKPVSMPPGSYGLPTIGHLPTGKIPITEHMRGLQRRYGSIFTTKWGSLPLVVLTEYRHMKKAFQHPHLQGRSRMSIFKLYNRFRDHGISGTDGGQWSRNHRFVQQQLHRLGAGRTQLEAAIQREAAMLVGHLDRHCRNQAATMDVFINLAVTNVIFLMVAERGAGPPAVPGPAQPADLIDSFLLDHPTRDQHSHLLPRDEKELVSIMFDLLFAGSETTAATLKWILLYMVKYPHIQARVHECLDAAVPRDTLPSLSDRDALGYLEATILDTLRLSSAVPTSMLHRATQPLSFEGYSIPQDTLVMVCAEMWHRDPAAWQQPDTLNPHHFLDGNGKLLPKPENFLPFSVGRRQCVGEPLARAELFLFVTALLQQFEVLAEGRAPPDGAPHPDCYTVNFPKPLKVVLRRR